MHVAAFVCLGLGWFAAIVFNFIAMAAFNSMFQAVNNAVPLDQRLPAMLGTWNAWRVRAEYRRLFSDATLPRRERRASLCALASLLLGLALCASLLFLGGPLP